MAWIERASYASPWSIHSIREELYTPRSTVLVAVLDRLPMTVAGYLCSRTIPAQEPGLSLFHLLKLTVHPGCRRRGVGSALLASLIEEAWRDGRIHSIVLDVARDNHAAVKLYLKHGFRWAGADGKVMTLLTGTSFLPTMGKG